MANKRGAPVMTVGGETDALREFYEAAKKASEDWEYVALLPRVARHFLQPVQRMDVESLTWNKRFLDAAVLFLRENEAWEVGAHKPHPIDKTVYPTGFVHHATVIDVAGKRYYEQHATSHVMALIAAIMRARVAEHGEVIRL